MGRVDFKRGRFTMGAETRSIMAGLRGYQSIAGDYLQYWRFDHEDSVEDPVYEEGTGTGKKYFGPMTVPALHVIHTQGDNQAGSSQGFYTNDTLSATVSFQQFSRTGLQRADIRTNNYLRDRVVYDEKVFRLVQIMALGQIERQDLILAMSATQVKADELVDDPQFAAYAVDPSAIPFS
jgi:hypothetical protein